MANLLRITLKTRDPTALRRLLSQHKLDLACGGPTLDEQGDTRIDAIVSREICAALESFDDAIEVVVDETLAPSLAARRSEVGTGDRFAGGTIAPKGVGEKM